MKGADGAWCFVGGRSTVPGGQPGPSRARCGPMPIPGTGTAVAGRLERRRRAAEQRCCVPSGCSRYAAGELIDPADPGDAVRVVCSNAACVAGSWMHADCYEDWQQRVLFYIR